MGRPGRSTARRSGNVSAAAMGRTLIASVTLAPAAHGTSLVLRGRQGDGVNFPVNRQRVKLAFAVLAETGDVFRLRKQRGAIRDFSVQVAEAPECPEGVVGIDIHALERRKFLSAINVA